MTHAKTEAETITEIWNTFQKPFIAINDNGTFVLINQNVNEMKAKPDGKIKGKISKSISSLFTDYRRKETDIHDTKIWHLVTTEI